MSLFSPSGGGAKARDAILQAVGADGNSTSATDPTADPMFTQTSGVQPIAPPPMTGNPAPVVDPPPSMESSAGSMVQALQAPSAGGTTPSMSNGAESSGGAMTPTPATSQDAIIKALGGNSASGVVPKPAVETQDNNMSGYWNQGSWQKYLQNLVNGGAGGY